MPGLDNIINAILEQAQAQAEQISADADKTADEIIKSSEAEAERRCAEIIEKARERAAVAAHIAQSGAQLESRNAQLAEKRSIIDSVIGDAVDMLAKLPDKEYFAVLEHIIASSAVGKGELILSESDKNRVPAGFIEKLNIRLASKGAALSLAADCVETGGGFILRYGGVEENLCFPEIAAQRREELSDMLDKLLFA